MMKRACAVAAAAMALLMGHGPTPVLAQQTGLAGIHTWVPVGRNKTCLADHFHSGSGNGKTKKLAERAAIQSWESFTVWEYGESWGRFSLSESRTINCDKSAGSEFSCQVSSRPCISRSAKARRKR